MKQITVGFSKSSSSYAIFSWLILLTQKTPYSHVYLKYTDEVTGNVMYWQASHTVVNSMDSTTFLGQETVVQEFNFQVSDKAFLAWMNFCEKNDGLPYGVMEICGLLMVQLASLFGIKINNPIRDAGATWVCDQVIAAGLNACENIAFPMPLNNMRPQDTYAMVATLPSTLT